MAADHGGHDRVAADRGVAGHPVPLPRHHDPQPLGPHTRMYTEAVNARAHRVTRRPPVEMLAEQARRLHRLPAAPFTAAFGVTRTIAENTH
ncbi:MAG TPA: hypothetical protein VFW21_03565 [Mycobacterium sp.]|nr:hypothetical protein [Mycobacterium sp.]